MNDCHEDVKLTEHESIELISQMLERAKRTEIGRLNFITLYGALGLLMYTLALVKPEAPLLMLWAAVPVLSYGVPFVYHKMWRRPATIAGRIVKRSWGMFALIGVIVPFMGFFGDVRFISPLMVMIGSCALFMLSGLHKQKTILVAAFVGFAFNALYIVLDGDYDASPILWSYVFFAYCVYIGLSLRGNVDEIRWLDEAA